ncbi:hypothetical protein HYW11_03015 [Candidatus Peregrinibacteria bacterium]|nr:hypothetical protein [Candidatus Peregrinibacteria bacterium]
MKNKERIRRFVEEIWQWHARNKRKLPWRDLKISDDTQRAYMILVSEVMLQQTQVPRVQIIFKQFIERFPTIRDLARASNRDVLIAWRGMGYNSRALRLRDAAQWIVTRYSLIRCANKKTKTSNEPTSQRATKVGFPHSMEELLTIPGIGPYTAAAIRNFAFNLPTPCVDTNIRRILHRTFIGPENRDGTWKKDDRYLLKWAGKVLKIAVEVAPRPEPSGSSADRNGSDFSGQRELDGEGRKFQQCHAVAAWHAALMDFGSLIQTKSNPKWHLCPLTAARIMRTTPKNFRAAATQTRREPGRLVGARFIPNRIFRGKVIDLLRDHPQGLTLKAIGRQICLDWSQEHREWLGRILTKLRRDSLLKNRGKKYVLS